ncbi:hypothetical protein QBC46DRAFT_383495 [Diplogelasinospora grovesii]|uniref:Secreted protein n=1 Tax=Diplogelasinospora grovesii TaxID=303347 RepID=A0AAN6S5H2_9PEZI|nr:hypothetical protein QBC46DRAFT_383495 [Diplogelasinospora grovesii]
MRPWSHFIQILSSLLTVRAARIAHISSAVPRCVCNRSLRDVEPSSPGSSHGGSKTVQIDAMKATSSRLHPTAEPK